MGKGVGKGSKRSGYLSSVLKDEQEEFTRQAGEGIPGRGKTGQRHKGRTVRDLRGKEFSVATILSWTRG